MVCYYDNKNRNLIAISILLTGYVSVKQKQQIAKHNTQGWRRGPRAQRKPMNQFRSSGLPLNRTAERRYSGT